MKRCLLFIMLVFSLPIYSQVAVKNASPIRSDTAFSIKVHVGNISNDTATVSEVLANRGLKVVIQPLPDRPVRIVGFYTTFINPALDTLAKHIQAEGNLFSSEQQLIIKRLTKGSKIMIDYVVLRGSDSRDRAAGPYFIFIK